MSPEECALADWEQLGQQDGRAGRGQDYLARRSKDCAEAGYGVERNAWLHGWQEGLVDFCTAERGFREGRSGSGYQHICPGDLEADFLFGYDTGLAIHEAEERVDNTRGRIEAARARLAELREADRRERDGEAIEETRSQLEELLDELREQELRLERARGVAQGRGFPAP
jgi:hypothetical protein